VFEAFAEFLLEGMRAQRDEGDGRILLSDNTGGGTVMLGPTSLLEFGFHPLYVLIYIYIYIELYVDSSGGNAKFDVTRTSWGGSLLP